MIYGLAFILGIGITKTAYAGSINGNEQSVLSTVNGQFKKDGIIYAVKPEYIHSARSYLAQDDVDLTAEQAQAAIAEIYANVQTGVESGYLVEIGRTGSKPEHSSESATSSLEKQSAGTSVQTNQEAAESKELKKEQSKSKEDPATETVSETIPAAGYESEPVKKEANGETEPNSYSSAISILELVDKAPPQTYEYLHKDTDERMRGITIPYGFFWGILGASAFGILLVLVVSVYKKLLSNHSHRRLRKILKYVLAVVIAAQAYVLCLSCGAWYGGFQTNAILSKLADTGYYTSIYSELRKDTSISFALLNIPDQVMDQSLTYDKVVIAARQQVESDLRGGTYKANTSLLIDPLKSDIERYLRGKSVTITDEAEAGLDLLMKRLDGKYTALLKWPFGSWWTRLRADFRKVIGLVIPVSFCFMILAQGILVFLHHYKHRAFSLGAKGVLLGSVVALLTFIGNQLIFSKRWGDIRPLYMNSFFQIYKSDIFKVGGVTCGIGVLIAAVALATVKAWKEGR